MTTWIKRGHAPNATVDTRASTFSVVNLAGIGSRAALDFAVRYPDPGDASNVPIKVACATGGALAIGSLLDGGELNLSIAFIDGVSTAGEVHAAMVVKAAQLGLEVLSEPHDPTLVLAAGTDTTGASTVDGTVGADGTASIQVTAKGRSAARTLEPPDVHIVTEFTSTSGLTNLPHEIWIDADAIQDGEFYIDGGNAGRLR